jgi:inositol phosphorylceramide synthase catalytic subunit
MLRRVHARAFEIWGPWWPMPTLIAAAYVGPVAAVGDFRPEHGFVTVVVLVFAYASRRSRKFLMEMLPYIVVGVGYDLVRYGRQALVSGERVMTCGLQRVDRALFPVGDGRSVQEWLAGLEIPALDLAFALPYAVFAYVALLYAAYLYFVDRPRMRRYLWAFAIANYLSYATWMLFPAAPPWYVHAHGCTADMGAVPSAAGLLRVDAMLGIEYFEVFYSRTASVFGAMPSMHNAYPLLGLFTAWRHVTWKTRPLHLAYFLVMFVASLYLDHHWVVDAIAGWVTALVAVWAAPWVVAALAPRTTGDSMELAAGEAN